MKKSISANAPIGIFDSGVGGVSVLRYAHAQLPHENYIYYGDIANAPYGEKPLDEIQALCRAATGYLANRGIKALLIACNTATAAAAEMLRSDGWPFPILGMEPAVKPACEELHGKTIAVMATPATLQLDKYQQLAGKYALTNHIVPLPCPGLSRLIETAGPDSAQMETYLNDLFASVSRPDGIVIGCTHYTYLTVRLRARFPSVRIFDGAAGTARYLAELLGEQKLLSSRSQQGQVELRSSLEDEETRLLFDKFFEMEIPRDDA
ncbi:MAG: glutamate racemase [Eubacteriales bacterium]|nr:glutamate racemase [Eubacteriales bacterium]